MITSNFEWNGEHCKTLVIAGAWDGLRRATHFFWQMTQAALNVSNPGPDRANPAKPGEPPHKRTGFGAANVVPEYDEATLTTRVGLLPNAKYMLFLELGTKAVMILPKKAKALAFKVNGKLIFCRKVNRPAQKPRPWLIWTLNKFWPQIKALAESGGQGGQSP